MIKIIIFLLVKNVPIAAHQKCLVIQLKPKKVAIKKMKNNNKSINVKSLKKVSVLYANRKKIKISVEPKFPRPKRRKNYE